MKHSQWICFLLLKHVGVLFEAELTFLFPLKRLLVSSHSEQKFKHLFKLQTKKKLTDGFWTVEENKVLFYSYFYISQCFFRLCSSEIKPPLMTLYRFVLSSYDALLLIHIPDRCAHGSAPSAHCPITFCEACCHEAAWRSNVRGRWCFTCKLWATSSTTRVCYTGHIMWNWSSCSGLSTSAHVDRWSPLNVKTTLCVQTLSSFARASFIYVFSPGVVLSC